MYRSVANLIGRNVDYLAHAISLHQRHASRGVRGHRGAVRVLCAVVQHGEEGACALVRGCIQDLLTSLDTKQVEAGLVWAGLRSLAKSCECLVASRTAKENVAMETNVESVDSGKDGNNPGGVVTAETELVEGERRQIGIESIADFFLQYHKAKGEEEAESGCVVGAESEGVAEESSYSQERPLPVMEQVCVEVMRRCGHHMSHDQPAIRLVVMETLQHCMRALGHDKVCT